MDEDLDAVDAARAFEDLRSEVRVTRRAAEDLPRAVRESLPSAPPDYGPELGRIVAELDAVKRRLAIFEKQPGLSRTPEDYATAMREAGEKAMGTALKDVRELGKALTRMIGQKRGQGEQSFWLVLVGLIALFIGLSGSPFAASYLPPLVRSEFARVAMGASSRWDAGQAMMNISNQSSWNAIVAANTLVQANTKAITACKAEATKTHKPQDCRIVVKTGE